MTDQLVEFSMWLTVEEIAGLEQLAKHELRVAEAHLRYMLQRELSFARTLGKIDARSQGDADGRD